MILIVKSESVNDHHLKYNQHQVTSYLLKKILNPLDQIQDDPCAFNMHGVLLEHQELYSQAEKAYKWSVALIFHSDDWSN